MLQNWVCFDEHLASDLIWKRRDSIVSLERQHNRVERKLAWKQKPSSGPAVNFIGYCLSKSQFSESAKLGTLRFIFQVPLWEVLNGGKSPPAPWINNSGVLNIHLFFVCVCVWLQQLNHPFICGGYSTSKSWWERELVSHHRCWKPQIVVFLFLLCLELSYLIAAKAIRTSHRGCTGRFLLKT